jgi:putative ABC transport system permease protein
MNRVALQMLLGDRVRFLGIVCGLTFAALLMTQQMSIYLGLMSRAHAAVRDIPQADLWLMDASMEAIDLGGVRGMSDTTLDRVRSVSGVSWAVEHLRIPTECNLGGGIRRDCLLIGIDDQTHIGLPPITQGRVEDLRGDAAVFLDEEGARKFAKAGHALVVGDSFEINDHRAVVAGFVRSKPAIWFGSYVYTTVARAKQWRAPTRRAVSFVVVGTKPGSDPAEVGRGITAATGLRSFTGAEFQAASGRYFAGNTGIPITFGTAVGLGFVVGSAIAGILFLQFTRDNLRYLGALKAMGASNGLLVRMTLLQALLVGFLGYGLGVGIATGFGHLTGMGQGQLAWLMPPWLLLAVAGGISVICAFAALLSLRSVLTLEPAVVFRG